MSIEITFVRHAETDANAAGVWQGHGDHALSRNGREQARALGDRLADKEFDFAFVSDLARARETVELAGIDATPDRAWREIDIGRWQGLTRSEVKELYPEESAALRSGDPVKMGGGESWNEFSDRVAVALADLIGRTPAGSRVLVVTHGGNIHSVLGRGLGFGGVRRPWPLERVRNASVSEAIVSPDGFHLQIYNDARHSSALPEGPEFVTLVRHAESEANLQGRWHGRTDGPLSPGGLLQAEAFAEAYGGVTRLYASPLERTHRTALAFAARHGLCVCLDERLVEIDFGAWEALTTSEIAERFPDEWAAVFDGGEDLPRGTTGETFAGAGRRMEKAVLAARDANADGRVACFTHGGSIWALTARILGLPWSRWKTLAIPSNTSATHVQVLPDGLRLVDYNLPPR